MTYDDFKQLPQAVQDSIERLFYRLEKAVRWASFIEPIYYADSVGCWIIPYYCGMVIGIERDGYAHS